jgi:5-keto 4-deoxyuronate isomerase
VSPDPKRITTDDLRAKFDEINDVVMGGVERQRTNAITTVVVVGVVVVAAAFLLGRRRGRRLATIVEIRRV